MEDFSTNNILTWIGYFCEKMEISPEQIKPLNICKKKKNVIPFVDTHKRVLIFANDSYPDLFYDLWEAGFGDYDVWFGTGPVPQGEIYNDTVKNLINKKIETPMVVCILNTKTRESYRIGIKNENFTRGPVHYVCKEIRAIIMSLLEVDTEDVICIVSGESIVIESAYAAYDGTIIAVEGDKDSMRSMVENVDKFGTQNVVIVPDVNESTMAKLPKPRLAFMVATSTLETYLQNFLAINPRMKLVLYTLELDILAEIRTLFKEYSIKNMEVIQVSVSKINTNGIFAAEPTPWIITGEA